MEKWKNKLIVFEGGDSTGGTSVSKALAKYLNDEGIETVWTFQPGDINWGTNAAITRSWCKDKRHNLHPLANFFAFQLDRVEQTSKIIVPALEAGKTVISDRWNYSTIAYQLYGKQLLEKYNMPEDVLNWLLTTAITSKEPDHVFYFPEKLNVGRIDDKDDLFDNAGDAFVSRVSDAYENMYEKADNWFRITPGSSVEETLRKVLDAELG